jgi:hypothetical protein
MSWMHKSGRCSLQEKLLRMTEDHRGDRAAAAQAAADKERGVGDWQHYQPPSAILKDIAARNAHARLGGPSGPPVSMRCAPSASLHSPCRL